MLADKHSLFDDRIYHKMALSLLKFGYEVHFVLIGESDTSGITDDGVYYHYVSQKTFSKNRFLNFLIKTIKNSPSKELYNKAVDVNADIYHFHDLWINKFAAKLKDLPNNPKVIYDVHEPFSANYRDYHSSIGAYLFSFYVGFWEKRKAKKYDCIITTEENVKSFFEAKSKHKNVQIVYNYTNLEKFNFDTKKEYDLMYCGGITELRGAMKILEAIRLIKKQYPAVKMLFLGSFFPKGLKAKMISYIEEFNLGDNVILKGNVPYTDVQKYYDKSKLGLGVFLPIETHKIILQIKIFEYMAMGLPIVGSNFGHISKIIKNERVGELIDPIKPDSIAEGVLSILLDENKYQKYSMNGQTAVSEKYNWGIMENKLIEIYTNLLK